MANSKFWKIFEKLIESDEMNQITSLKVEMDKVGIKRLPSTLIKKKIYIIWGKDQSIAEMDSWDNV